MTGTITTADMTGTSERPAPASSVDDVTIAREEAGTRVVTTSRDAGADASQELVVLAAGGGAHLERLSHRPDHGVGFTIAPGPPPLLARLPYVVGDAWEIAWNDPTSGVSGVGTGRVERREAVVTSAGAFDTIVVTVVQELRGAVVGTLTVTAWIDPATGIQPKRRTIAEFRDATGATRSDTERILRSGPGG